MGANQSVHSTQEINDASRITEKHPICTMDGQKTLTLKTEVHHPLGVVDAEPTISAAEEDATGASSNVVDFSDDDNDDDDSDFGDEEDEDGKACCVRQRILF
jgi:hypothetical protein